MSRIATFKDKIPKNSILARIFGLRQGYKDKSCPGQDFRETRTRWHPWTPTSNNQKPGCNIDKDDLLSVTCCHIFLGALLEAQWTQTLDP